MTDQTARSGLLDHATDSFAFLEARGAQRTLSEGEEFTVLGYGLPEVVFELEFDWREMLTTLNVRDGRVDDPPQDGRLVADGRHIRHGLATSLALAGIAAPEFHRAAREVEGHWGPARVRSLIDTESTGLRDHLDGLLARIDRVFPDGR